MTLAEIQAMPIYGNAMSDRSLFMAIDEFVKDESNSHEERYQALLKMDEAMGSLRTPRI